MPKLLKQPAIVNAMMIKATVIAIFFIGLDAQILVASTTKAAKTGKRNPKPPLLLQNTTISYGDAQEKGHPPWPIHTALREDF